MFSRRPSAVFMVVSYIVISGTFSLYNVVGPMMIGNINAPFGPYRPQS